MRACRRVVVLFIATTAVLVIASVGMASASQLTLLSYRVSGLQPSNPVQIYYTSGVNTAYGGTIVVSSGSVLTAGLATNAMFLQARRGPVNAEVLHYLAVGSGSIAGRPRFPPARASRSRTRRRTSSTSSRTARSRSRAGMGWGSSPQRAAPGQSAAAVTRALGGSEYVVTLNAVRSNPKGAHLILKFAS